MSHPWPMKSLDEIFEIARGGSPRPIDAFYTDADNGVNWIMIGDTKDGSKYIDKTKKKIDPAGISKSREVSPGDFLLTNSMSFGRPYIMRTSGCIHDGWLVLSPKNGKANTDYFYHLLGSNVVYAEFSRLAAGATVKNLNIDLVKSVKVPLPPPEEQRRIAAILDAADALRQKRRQALRLLEQLSQAIFIEMFGDPVTNPKGWDDTKTLGECADIASGVTKGRNLNGKVSREVPYLAVYNVQDKSLKLDHVKTIEATGDEIERYRLRSDDLLLTEGGDPDKLGRGTLWNDELPECIHQNHVFRVRLHSKDIEPLYLNWLVGSQRGKSYFLRSAKQTTGIASINMTQLRAFPLLIPPGNLQTEFKDRIRILHSTVARTAAHATSLEELFASFQHRAFRGEL